METVCCCTFILRLQRHVIAPPVWETGVLDQHLFFTSTRERSAVHVPNYDTDKVAVFAVAKIARAAIGDLGVIRRPRRLSFVTAGIR